MARAQGRPGPVEAPAIRDESPTMTDPVELEAARVISTFTSPPPALEVSETEVPLDSLPAELREDPAERAMLTCVPVVSASTEVIATLPLDSRAGFLLSLLDGSLTVEQVLDVSGMPRDEALGLLRDLQARGVLVLRSSAPAYRVIAEGDDDVGRALTVGEAMEIALAARTNGKRYVAIMDEATGTLLDEDAARAAAERE
jgi:hypothetical protein